MRISLNAQQFVLNRENVSFTYYDAPRVAEISPTAGPMLGGTLVNVSGVSFALGSHYVCAFGATVVPATAHSDDGVIACRAPPAADGTVVGLEVPLEVSLNARVASQRVPFRYLAASPAIESFSPSSGPSEGATTVVITGSGLSGGSD